MGTKNRFVPSWFSMIDQRLNVHEDKKLEKMDIDQTIRFWNVEAEVDDKKKIVSVDNHVTIMSLLRK